ncbi:MAG TPA: HAMP domain-containing sensor histidine kinase [Pseudonocardia sp.]|nr:HAMP domain-containing sensor histidine kinase [Pseudonocardia sp.]
MAWLPRPVAALRTVSLRRRVIFLGVGVLVAVLLVTGVATDVIFSALSRAELNARVADRVAAAAQLAARHVPPGQLVRQLTGGPLQAQLITPAGDEYGGVAPSGPTVRIVRRVLPDKSRLSLSVDLDTVTVPQQRLRKIMIEVGLAGLALAVLALLATTRAALAPLDAMTTLARSISRGQRGRRLAPVRTDTELGRTAEAFDDMLDALEGAEQHARDEQTRARTAEAAALDAADRLRRFVDDAAHELRTPITGILAAAEAATSTNLDAEQRDHLQLLLIHEARRGQRLVEDLLHLARLEAGVPPRREPVELRALAEQQAERTALLSPTLTVTVTGEPATVTADGAQLAQLLANLLDNARHHTPDGGTITLNIEPDPAVHDAAEPGHVTVTVVDTGPGIDPADRERIFDRLTRLDTARARTSHNGGAGLGLAIARGIANAHLGTLRCVDPPPGTTGAAFTLTLPRTPPAA